MKIKFTEEILLDLEGKELKITIPDGEGQTKTENATAVNSIVAALRFSNDTADYDKKLKRAKLAKEITKETKKGNGTATIDLKASQIEEIKFCVGRIFLPDLVSEIDDVLEGIEKESQE